MLKIVLLVTFSLTYIQSLSTPESTHYEAVVVEYASDGKVGEDSPLQIIAGNWATYSRCIAEAEGADIIVFPECGLTTAALPAKRDALRAFLSRIPDPAAHPVPCDAPPSSQQVSEVVRNASCAARRHGIYVVLNTPEEFPCAGDSRCPPDGVFIYNTNVAFDRNGSLVARYRKFHLFNEPGFNTPPEPELAVFETDFGARFATFICFDILFEAPALELVRQNGVTDIAFSTAWFSELPFLTAVETQAGWAYANNVTMLAAGLDRPERSNTGSGVYWGDGGVLNATMRHDRGTRTLKVRVPKRSVSARVASEPAPDTASRTLYNLTLAPLPIATSELGHLKLWQDDLRAWATMLLPPAGGAFTATLCPSAKLCCHAATLAEVPPATPASRYFYRVGAFDGVRTYSHLLAAGVQACAVFACLDTVSLASCGRVEDGRAAGLAFERIALTAVGLESRRTLQMPSTLETESLLPLEASNFRFAVQTFAPDEASAGSKLVSLATTRPVDESLLTFGVYARAFARDRPLHEALPAAVADAFADAVAVASPAAAAIPAAVTTPQNEPPSVVMAQQSPTSPNAKKC